MQTKAQVLEVPRVNGCPVGISPAAAVCDCGALGSLWVSLVHPLYAPRARPVAVCSGCIAGMTAAVDALVASVSGFVVTVTAAA